jgi:hypothetical protein
MAVFRKEDDDEGDTSVDARERGVWPGLDDASSLYKRLFP